MTSSMIPSDLRESYVSSGQGHVFKYVDNGVVKDEEKLNAFISQLRDIDPVHVNSLYQSTMKAHETTGGSPTQTMEPIESFGSLESSSIYEKERWFTKGVQAITENKVAVVVLSGGQGTRLGFDGPKGMYDIGLPSGKSLFQLQAERLLRVCELASSKMRVHNFRVPWYIMTSQSNDDETRKFFASNQYFGVPKNDVFFFSQGTLPCMDPTGKLILESATKLSFASDGNGGIYPSLKKSGALDDMKRRGVEHLHVFSIDNALVRVADPFFIGYCIEKEADCGNKSVWKSSPDEKVGVVVKLGGKPCVVEYSDMDRETCERRDSSGKLVFGAGNICNHYFSRLFIEKVVTNMSNMYHVAHKKIPEACGEHGETTKPLEINGIKLESFIFDVFPMSKNMVLFEASRVDEFAPVKNAPGSDSDSPDTARKMISSQAKCWALAWGAEISESDFSDSGGLCEISPLSSYGGEGLGKRIGRMTRCPFHLQ